MVAPVSRYQSPLVMEEEEPDRQVNIMSKVAYHAYSSYLPFFLPFIVNRIQQAKTEKLRILDVDGSYLYSKSLSSLVCV